MTTLLLFLSMFVSIGADTFPVNRQDTILLNSFTLDEITVTSIHLDKSSTSSVLNASQITNLNVGQEPSHVFKHLPGIFAMSDNGTEFGYGYYRIRGLDQTRINVTLDGMPWNEAEDFGSYFANSPDLMSSMHRITVQRGASSRTSGISASAGTILLESVDLYADTTSHADLMYGADNTYKASVVYNMGEKKGWGFHFKATQSGTDGYRDYSQNHSHAATAKIGYRFRNGMTIDLLSMNGYHTNGQGWIGSYKDELLSNARANGNLSTETDNWYQSVNKLQFRALLAHRTMLTASAYFQFQTGSYRMDLDNYMRRIVDPASDTTGKLYNYGLTHYLYGGNIYVKDNTVDFMEITAGVNAYGFDRRHFMDTSNPEHVSNLDDSDLYDNCGHKTDITALFAILFHATDKLKAGFNVQYRFVDFQYREQNSTYTSGYVLNDNGEYELQKTQWNFLNGGLSLMYDISSHHQVHASLAVTNREPTRSTMLFGNESATFVGGQIIYATTKHETVHDIELGYMLNYDIIRIDLNAFFMKFKDELVLTGNYGENGLPEHVNADNSFRTGIELSLDLQPIRGLHLLNNTAWSKNLMRLSKDDPYRQHVLTPEWTLDQDIHYDYKWFTIGCDFNLRSEMYVETTNDDKYKLPVNMSLDAYATIRFFKDHFNLNVKLTNIANRINYSNGAIGATGEMLYIQEARFGFLCSLKYLF